MNRRDLLARAASACILGPTLLTACGGGGDDDAGDQWRTLPPLELLTVHEILNGLATARFTSVQLVTAYLERIRTFANYNAFTFQNENALAQARESDAQRLRGEQMGVLAGVPIAIKESMDYVGAPSTMGWSRLSARTGGRELFPARNAAIVQLMIDAGAIILGKTNIPCFSDDGTRANSSWAGPTYSAIDPSFAPGASSTGTATAVAGGLAAAGLAEETGGSIQNPAAAQSLVGVKTTFGLIDTSGVVPLAHSTRDVVGPIAKDVRDAAIMLDAMVGNRVGPQRYAAGLSATALQGARLGLYGPGWKRVELSSPTRDLYAAACGTLRSRGVTLVDDPFAGSGFAELALDIPYDYRGTESAAYDLNQYVKGLGLSSLAQLTERAGMSPFDPEGPLAWYVDGLPALAASLEDPTRPPDLSSFDQLSRRYQEIFESVMGEFALNALVFPHATDALPTLQSNDAISETTVSAINIAGLPAVTVPAGKYANGSPFSLLFVGRRFSEGLLLSLAYDFEVATRQRVMPNLRSF